MVILVRWGVSRGLRDARVLPCGVPCRKGEIIVAAPSTASSNDVIALARAFFGWGLVESRGRARRGAPPRSLDLRERTI